MPNLYALAVFEAAGRTGNFSRAAAALGLTQPSVSRHVANLEARLGVPLFDRERTGLRLTRAGQRLHNAVSLGYGHIRTELDAVGALRPEGAIRLACTPALFTHWFVSRYSSLQAALDTAEVRVTLSEWFDELDAGDVDVVLRWKHRRDAGPDFVPLFVETAYPVCSRTYWERHLKGRKAASDPEALKDHPLLQQVTGESGFFDWSSWFETLGHAADFAQPPATYSNFQLLLQAVREDMGVGLSWTYLTDDLVDAGELVRVGPRVRHEPVVYGLAFTGTAVAEVQRERLIAWFRNEWRDHAGAPD
jgi:DNA-binding transcriptional LysR family regulator